ncbi:hypothetical protein IJ750_07725 [bacterium]|nr:hypothetical protein [bacterium]
MGMAASQARYLALTARKTNTEWEGQQINQARTALANQSANLFNRLLAMEVPNAPKTTDYTELQYSYSDGDNNSVLEEWHQLSDKNSDYNYVVKHYYYADIFTGAKKMLQDPQVQVGDVLKEIKYNNNTANITYGSDGVTVTYKLPSEDDETTIHYNKITETNDQLKDFATAKNLALDENGLPKNGNVYGYLDESTNTWHFFLANIQEQNYSHITQEMVDNDENLKNYLASNNYLDDDGNLKLDNIYGLSNQQEDGSVNWTFITDDSGADNVIQYIGNASDNKDYSMAYNSPAFVGNSKLKELSELIVNDEIDQVADLAQILRDCPDSSINQYVSFDSNGNLQYNGSGIYTFELNGKTYYTTNADLWNSVGQPYDPNKPIDLQEKLAYYNASYINTKIEATNHALLESDGNGRFKSVKFDDDSIVYNLNVETVTDEAAYQDAMNQYLYKKEVYEKTIADINAKTSLIQKEDRTLELRLKQLDTEQLALKTEMDAVQKVIKDNVEKTFKTFSD